MLENIIYHTVIIVFIIALLMYLFSLQKKLDTLQKALIPFVLAKSFEFPQNRSLFIRGLRAIEELLSKKFGMYVYLEYDKTRQKFFAVEFEFFTDILYSKKMLWHKSNKKYFVFVQHSKNDFNSHTIDGKNIVYETEFSLWELRIT